MDQHVYDLARLRMEVSWASKIFLIYFAIGRIIEQLEGHEFDHTFSGEEFDVLRILSLLLSQGKDGSAEPGIEGVVEEFAYGHLINLRFVFLVGLNQCL